MKGVSPAITQSVDKTQPACFSFSFENVPLRLTLLYIKEYKYNVIFFFKVKKSCEQLPVGLDIDAQMVPVQG